MALQRIVWFRVKVGTLDLSLGDVLAFAVTLWISILLSRLVRFLLEEGLSNKGLSRGVPAAISRTASYAVVAVGTVLAFLASGMDLTKFTRDRGHARRGHRVRPAERGEQLRLRPDPPLRAAGAGRGRRSRWAR